ncbi:MAG: hypothetical protein ACI4IN_05885 [Eubacterium sp.]
MKITYITGATCTGKTTYAQSISNNEIIVSLDALSKAIRFTFDGFELYTAEKVSIRPTMNNDKFLKFVKTYTEYLAIDYPNKDIIIEGCHFTPNEFLSAFPNAKIIALGITNKSTALKQIHKKDWMAKLDNDVKIEYANQIVEYSNELRHKFVDCYIEALDNSYQTI